MHFSIRWVVALALGVVYLGTNLRFVSDMDLRGAVTIDDFFASHCS